MKKCSISLIKLFVLGAALFSTSFVSHAGGFASEATCYPLVHGENGMGSTNSLNLPHMRTASTWTGQVYLTNTSDSFVNVKLKFSDYAGAHYAIYDHSFDGAFSQSNSPFNTIGGAILKPNETAKVIIYDDNFQDALVGRVEWQADACIKEALVVSVRNNFNGPSAASTLLFLNGGLPF